MWKPVQLECANPLLKKRKYDSADSKRRLMASASDVFSKDGYDAATTRKVAKMAGVNESLIQRYFKNKFGLFSAIIQEFQNRVIGTLPYPPADSLENELKNFFAFRLEFAQTEKKLIRLIFSRSLVDKNVREQMKNIYQNGIPSLIQRFEKLQAQGKISKDVNLRNASILVGAFSFSLNLSCHILGTLELDLTEELTVLANRILTQGLSAN